MSGLRFIPRLDIKGSNLIKGIQLEGLRVIGDPQVFAKKYYEQGADELIYMDAVASLYGRNNLSELVKRTSSEIFIPLTVGGGIRSIEDVHTLLMAGADKVAINTAAVNNPELIKQIARTFGSQCLVISIEAKRTANNCWEVFTNNGREKTGIDVVEWAKKSVDLGAGEILLTSVDNEGTNKGFDIPLVHAIATIVSVPVIASGGMSQVTDLIRVFKEGAADAVAIANMLHYAKIELPDLKQKARDLGLPVRHLT